MGFEFRSKLPTSAEIREQADKISKNVRDITETILSDYDENYLKNLN